ncbi:MAG: RNA polymerase factor sigma-54 [Planctomycetota bacterium]
MSMHFNQSQSMRAGMKLGQSMKLAPSVIQSMEILQMSLADLEARIEQELESNITLELAEPGGDEPGASENEPQHADDRHDADADSDSFERLDEFTSDVPDVVENEFDSSARVRSDDFEPGRPSQRLAGEPDAKSDAMAQAPARQGTLQDQLFDQWRFADIDETTARAGEAIIGSLDEDGYLRVPLSEIADKAPANAGLTEPALTDALQAVQLLLDPPGTAARDVRECLLLQLDAMEDAGEPVDASARALIENHLDDLSQNRLPRIAEATGLSMDAIKQAIEFMRRLSLAPASALTPTRAEFVIPDAIVEYDEDHDRYIAYLADRRHSQLQINREYALMAKDKQLEKKDRDFIKTNVANAQWLIDAVEQRSNTLLRVLRAVVDAQRDYFDFGPEQLRPLPMTQVAERLGVHVATVSRAVADKHVQTPRGIVPLRGFFTGGLSTDSGDDMSYDAVKAALKEVVGAEDKAKPLSDDALAKELKAKGIDIARRTVAKYRGQLDIPSARLRKAH